MRRRISAHKKLTQCGHACIGVFQRTKNLTQWPHMRRHISAQKPVPNWKKSQRSAGSLFPHSNHPSTKTWLNAKLGDLSYGTQICKFIPLSYVAQQRRLYIIKTTQTGVFMFNYSASFLVFKNRFGPLVLPPCPRDNSGIRIQNMGTLSQRMCIERTWFYR